MRIDIHTHVTSRKFFGKPATDFGPEIFRDNQGREFLRVGKETLKISGQFYDPERRIRDMDATNVDIQALLPGPSIFLYSVKYEFASKCCKIQNESVAEIVRDHHDRFVGFATVPLQKPKEAAAELETAVEDLGMKGVEIGSNINGKNLDSKDLWPLYDKVQELDIPIVVHPVAVAGEDRLQRYHLKNLIGNPLDTSIAIASVIFGGVLNDFPDLKLCFLHAGGFVPYQIGRLDHGYKVRPEPKVNISKPPSKYLKLLYFDTITHYPPALKYLIETVGSSNVLMGSDYPADMGDPDPVLTVSGLSSIDEESKQKILGKNAANLLKLNIH